VNVSPSTGTVARWLEEWSAGKAAPKDGSGGLVDFDGTVRSERLFERALISEVTVPAMDAGSREAAYFTLRMHAERIVYGKRHGKVVSVPASARQKVWLASNFRLSLGDLPDNAVAGIDAFTIRRSVDVSHKGRDTRLQAGRLEFPNLKVTISGRDVGQWEEWFERFVIAGENGQDKELNGAIDLLDASLDSLGTIALSQVGIFALAPAATSARTEVSRFTAELYVEKMDIRIK
jgi:hypothetical protein